MSSPVTAEAPAAFVGRLRRTALMVAAVAGVLTALGAVLAPSQFFRSYLFGYLFWLGLTIGCLSVSLIQHLTGGMWGLAIRRVLEAGTRTLPLMAVLFLPIALGLPRIYEWARPEAVAADELLQKKQAYLNPAFFLARAVFYFAVWWLLVHLLNKWSLRLDGGMDLRLARRLRSLSGLGLVLLGLTITFSAVDWAMSLDPHWYSTVYGILFMVGDGLGALALAIVVVALIGGQEPLDRLLDRTVFHDLGKLLLAFVMLWAYISFSQFLVIWAGNLPEEIPWYLQRLHGGWSWLALALVIFHFALPFVLLLSRSLKRDARLLAAVAGGVLLARLADLFWLVGPDLHGHAHHGGLAVHWLDLTAPAALGGLWVWFFGREMAARPLLPLGEPEVVARLGQPRSEAAHG